MHTHRFHTLAALLVAPLAGMVAGAVVVIAWKQVAVGMYGSQLYEIVPGFVAATLAIIVVSLLGRAPAPAILEGHAQVRHSLRQTGY